MAPQEQFLLLAMICCYLVLDFYVKTMIRFSLRDKQLFRISDNQSRDNEGRLYLFGAFLGKKLELQ